MLLAILVYLSFDRTSDQAVREGLWKRNLKKEKKEIVKVCVHPGSVEPYCGSQASYASVDVHGILSV